MQIITITMNSHFKQMVASGKQLYRVNCSGASLWEIYMHGYGEDPIFRDPQSSEHNCNACRHFIEHYGNIVTLNDDNTFTSIFDFDIPKAGMEEYGNSIIALRNAIHAAEVSDLFVVTKHSIEKSNYDKCPTKGYSHLGLSKNVKCYTKEEADKFGVVKPDQIIMFHHLYLEVPSQYILNTSESVASFMATAKAKRESLEKALEEFSQDTVELVIDLIEQNSILNGEAHLKKLKSFLDMVKLYATVPQDQRNVWLWKQSQTFSYCHIRNEVIGTLLQDIQGGVELEEACKSWNRKIDPVNYMRAKSPITKAQIAAAQKFVEDNGYVESFTRRCATMADIEASEILHIHNGEVKAASIFDAVKPTRDTKAPKLDNLREVSIDVFMKDILPDCTSLEVLLENRHRNNLVTLITAENKDSKRIFKWDNNFSWTYNGNLAGKSQIAQAVKNAGGFVDAPFRFSIMWNEDGRSIVDLDAHAIEPSNEEIYFSHKYSHSGGQLDVDMISPRNIGVENIFWNDMSRVHDGLYRFFVRNYNGGSNSGFRAEIALFNEVYTYQVTSPVYGNTRVADVRVKNGVITDIQHHAPLVGQQSATIYGLQTQQFHQVNLVCLSPNYWKENVGNKHYFFFMDGCKADDKIRGFHNEFLRPELTPHRKVLDILAHTMQVESTDGQLSGLGFNATVHDELVVRIKGKENSIIKIKF